MSWVDLELGTNFILHKPTSKVGPESKDLSEGLAVPETGQQKLGYWSLNFLLVLFPFLPIGMPLHNVDTRGQSSSDAWRILGSKNWLQTEESPDFGNRPWYITILMICLGFPTLFLNGLVIYYLGFVFYHFLIAGVLVQNLVQTCWHFALYLPLAVLVDYMWLYGPEIRALIGSFDELERTVRRHLASAQDLDDVPRYGLHYRRRLAFIYALVAAIHVIHFFLVRHQSVKERWTTDDVRAHCIDYAPFVLYTLILPLYACVCWGFRSQFEGLGVLIDSFISQKTRLGPGNLSLLKMWYKRIADGIVYVNVLSAYAMSWILGVVGTSYVFEIKGTVLYLVMSGLKYMNGMQDNPWANPHVKLGVFGGPMLNPDVIRYMIGQIVNTALYFVLVTYTVWQARYANDEARFFHVWLNDFATAQPQAVPPVDAEMYRNFHLLKLYVHSRMEQESPALLSIAFLPMVLNVGRKLTVYNVRH